VLSPSELRSALSIFFCKALFVNDFGLCNGKEQLNIDSPDYNPTTTAKALCTML